MRLKDKTAIVTGGASGFGEGIVRKFVAEGARVVIADIDIAAAKAVAQGVAATATETDVSSDASVRNLIDQTRSAFGRIDILVNNAGIGHLPQAMEDLSEAEFDRLFAVNVRSVYLTARHVVPLMKAAGRGAILNV